MRTPAGSFCKAGVRFFCARPTGRFCKTGARLLRPTGRRSSPFVRRPRASIHRPQRPALPPACPTRAHARFPLVMAPFPRPLHAPLHARPLSTSSCPVRTRPLSLPFSPFPPPGPAIIRSSIPGARPLSHSVRPAAAPVSPAPPLLSRPFLQFRAPPLQKNAVRAAGLTRRGCGPGFRACLVRFCGLPRAGRDEDGGATVAAGHKTGLPRGRGAGIRRNGRRNRQAGLPRAGARRGYGPGFRACIVRFCGPTRAREGTRMAAQRSLPP